MDKHSIAIIGLIVSLIGTLTILVNWLELTFEDYYGITYYWYNGIELMTSGDFTDPKGVFHSMSGSLGRFVPMLITIAFICTAIRFLVRKDRKYMLDVGLSMGLVVIACIYMIYWVHPGTYYGEGFIEQHSFGTGPILGLVIAFLNLALAYIIDHNPEQKPEPRPEPMPVPEPEPEPVPSAMPIQPETVEHEEYAFFCPNCGKGVKKENANFTFCMSCGTKLDSFFEKKKDQ